VADNSKSDRLFPLVPWALQRLLEGHYRVTLDSEGNPEHLEVDPDFGNLPLSAIIADLKASYPRCRQHRSRRAAAVGV